MASTQPSDNLDQKMLVPKILWVAFLLSHFIFAAVFYSVRGTAPEPEPVIGYLLATMGTLLPLLTPVARKMVLGQAAAELPDQELGALINVLFVPLVLTFALCEAGAIFGAMLLMLGFDLVYWAVPAGVALAFHLINFPSVARFETWRRDLTPLRR